MINCGFEDTNLCGYEHDTNGSAFFTRHDGVTVPAGLITSPVTIEGWNNTPFFVFFSMQCFLFFPVQTAFGKLGVYKALN